MWTQLLIVCWGRRTGICGQGARSRRGGRGGERGTHFLRGVLCPFPRSSEQGGVLIRWSPWAGERSFEGYEALSFPSLFGGKVVVEGE